MTEKRLELVRGLGAWASAAIVIGTMIGTGIFLKPAEMAREGPTVSVVFAAWIVGAILSIFGALSFAELGAAIPEAGGEYAYLRRAFGPVYGFLFGWMHSIVGRPSSLASISAGMIRFVSFLILYLGAAARGVLACGYDRCELSRSAARWRGAGFSDGHKNYVRRHCYRGSIFFAGGTAARSRPVLAGGGLQCRSHIRRVSRHPGSGAVGL